jgi:hypothetical protein
LSILQYSFVNCIENDIAVIVVILLFWMCLCTLFRVLLETIFLSRLPRTNQD